MTKSSRKSGDRLGDWTIQEQIAVGGNGIVWEVRRHDGELGALKLLKKPRSVPPNERFRDEVDAMNQCEDINGVLPLSDWHLPASPSENDPAWFVTPIATPLDKQCDSISLEEAVELCSSLARTLSEMHKRGFSHRDIKPSNIFLFNDRWCLGDFGLADFPSKTPITPKGEKLGPMYYIAPEMLHDASTSDGRSADVYSLGKLLWKLATGHKFPLPGVHSRDEPALTISANVHADNASRLDALIEAMTLVRPEQRPTMDHVANELVAWSAPPPTPTRPTDLARYAKRAHALTEAHVESQRRHESIQAAADTARGLAFAEFRPTIETIKLELEQAAIGAVTIQWPAGGNALFYRLATGDHMAGTDRGDQVWFFQYSVEVRIDGGETRGSLLSGLNIGVRNIQGEPDPLHDIYAPVLAATGHLVTTEFLLGDSWQSQPSGLNWGDNDTFVLGQPRQSNVLNRFGSGLEANLASAVDNLLSGMEIFG